MLRLAFALLVITASAHGLRLDVVSDVARLALMAVLAAFALPRLVGWTPGGES